MSVSAQMSSSSYLDGTLTPCQPPLDVYAYIWDHMYCLFTLPFSTHSFHGAAFLDQSGSGFCNSVAGTCRKRWKYWAERNAIESLPNSARMDLPFVCCREQSGFQHHLSLVLEEVGQCRVIPAVVWPDSLALPEDVGHLYYVLNRLYWACKLYF